MTELAVGRVSERVPAQTKKRKIESRWLQR